MMEKKRSIGVTILGSLNRILFGFFSLLLCTFSLFMSFNEEIMNAYSEIGSPVMVRLFFIYLIIISAALMITGHGVLKLRESARIHTIYVGVVMLVFNALSSLKYISSPLLFLGGLFYPALLIFFFTRPEVKRQFMERSPEQSEGGAV